MTGNDVIEMFNQIFSEMPNEDAIKRAAKKSHADAKLAESNLPGYTAIFRAGYFRGVIDFNQQLMSHITARHELEKTLDKQ